MSVANAPGNELVRRNAYLALSGSIVNYSKSRFYSTCHADNIIFLHG
jgi:hypothetical protein